MHDYMLTAEFFNPHQEIDRIRAKYQMELDARDILPMLEVHEAYLADTQFFRQIRSRLRNKKGCSPLIYLFRTICRQPWPR